MELSASSRQQGLKNYTIEFREKVAARDNDLGRSIAGIAEEHGLNANMVTTLARQVDATGLVPAEETFVPVQMSPSPPRPMTIIVERGPARVRPEGQSDLDVLRAVLACLHDVPRRWADHPVHTCG
jgi:transposase